MLHALMRAIEDARSVDRIDATSRAVYEGLAAGRISDEVAQRLLESAHSRRNGLREERETRTTGVVQVGSIKCLFPAKRKQRAPVHGVKLERRRTVVASGWMPPAIAARFTMGEQAVLAVIAREFATKGACELCVDAVAALAGVSRRLVQSATRLAHETCLLHVEIRPVRGGRHRPNRIIVMDGGWRAWLARRGGGCKSSHPMSNRYPHSSPVAPVQTVNQASKMVDRALAKPVRDSLAGSSPGARAMR